MEKFDPLIRIHKGYGFANNHPELKVVSYIWRIFIKPNSYLTFMNILFLIKINIPWYRPIRKFIARIMKICNNNEH